MSWFGILWYFWAIAIYWCGSYDGAVIRRAWIVCSSLWSICWAFVMNEDPYPAEVMMLFLPWFAGIAVGLAARYIVEGPD